MLADVGDPAGRPVRDARTRAGGMIDGGRGVCACVLARGRGVTRVWRSVWGCVCGRVK